MLFIKPRGLKTEGIEHRVRAAATPGFVLKGLQQPAAEACTAQGLGQVEQVEKGRAQGGFAGDAAEDLPRGGILDQHRQWLAIVEARDGFIERGKTAAEKVFGVGGGLVADFNEGCSHHGFQVVLVAWPSAHVIGPGFEVYRLAIRITEVGVSTVTGGLGGLPALGVGIEYFGIIPGCLIQGVVPWLVVIKTAYFHRLVHRCVGGKTID
jgi:hypothetical protein